MVSERISDYALTCLIVLICFIAACASMRKTEPNKPYSGPYPAGFNELSAKNPLLAKELGKLPELQDGISNKESMALERIVELYVDNPEDFNSAFSQMYQVGMPEVRKYCSPLQAVLWLAEDEKLQSDIIKDYSLEKLLIQAWTKEEGWKTIFTEDDKKKIVEGVRDKNKQNTYKVYFADFDEATVYTVLSDVKHNPDIFTRRARSTIRSAIRRSKKGTRWNDFSTAIDRLNAPELIDYYERTRISYAPWRTIPFYVENYETNFPACARYVFENDRGDCSYTSAFTVYCLRKAGYKASRMRIKPRTPRYEYHDICVFEWNSKRHVMDNGTHRPRGIFLFDRYKAIFRDCF